MPIHSRSLDESKIDEPKIVDLAVPRIIGVLPPIAGGEENLLRKDAWLNPLRVEFDRWSDSAGEPGMYDTVQLFFGSGTVPVHERRLEGPIPDTEFWLEVPPSKLEEGIHRLFYRVLPWNGSIPRESVPVAVTIDKTPAILAADNQLIFPLEILPPDNELTARYLELNNDQVKAVLPVYTTPRPWDSIEWFWGIGPGDLNPGGIIELDDLNYADPVVVTIGGELIRDRGNGSRFVQYRVQDRAGNQSLYSAYVELVVDATAIPRTLPWPSVEKAVGTGEQQTLDPLQAITGAIVEVPAEAIIYPGEQVWVQWGVPETLGACLVKQPISSGQRRYQIEMESVAAHIGRTLPVTYVVIDEKEQEHDSTTRRLQIETIPSNRLKAVKCDGLSGGNLSYAAVAPQGARLTLDVWPLMTTDHWVLITMTGVGSSGQDSVFQAVSKRAVTDQELINGIGVNPEVRVPKAILNTLRRNEPLTGKVYVSFDGGETWPPMAAPNFPLLRLTFVD